LILFCPGLASALPEGWRFGGTPQSMLAGYGAPPRGAAWAAKARFSGAGGRFSGAFGDAASN